MQNLADIQLGHDASDICFDKAHCTADLPDYLAAPMASKAVDRHSHGERANRLTGAIVDRDPEGCDTFLGLFDVQRETGLSCCAQLASEQRERIGIEPPSAGIRLVPGFIAGQTMP